MSSKPARAILRTAASLAGSRAQRNFSSASLMSCESHTVLCRKKRELLWATPLVVARLTPALDQIVCAPHEAARSAPRADRPGRRTRPTPRPPFVRHEPRRSDDKNGNTGGSIEGTLAWRGPRLAGIRRDERLRAGNARATHVKDERVAQKQVLVAERRGDSACVQQVAVAAMLLQWHVLNLLCLSRCTHMGHQSQACRDVHTRGGLELPHGRQ